MENYPMASFNLFILALLLLCFSQAKLFPMKLWTTRGKIHKCSTCQQETSNYYQMKKHYIKCHPSRYIENYPHLLCTGCLKLFPKKASIDSHLKSCSDSQGYQIHQESSPLAPLAKLPPTMRHLELPKLPDLLTNFAHENHTSTKNRIFTGIHPHTEDDLLNDPFTEKDLIEFLQFIKEDT